LQNITTRTLSVVLAAAVFMSYSPAANASTAKVGGTCKSVGLTSGSGAKKLVCVKKGSKRVWALAPVPAPVIGSLQNPAPLGSTAKVGDFTVSVSSIQDNAGSAICAENFYNDGCTYDSKFNGIVDPASTGRWIRIIVQATNSGNTASDFSPGDVGFVSNGSVVWNGYMQPVAKDRISDLTILPSATATGSLYAYIQKGTNLEMLAVKQSAFSDGITFFLIH
jgi:hypothetical protein